MSKIQMEYGGVYSIPMSFLIDKYGEVIRVYPGAILKQFDPNMFADLIFNIESSIADDLQINNLNQELNEKQ